MQACTHRWTDGWIWASPTSLRPPPHAGPPSISSLHLHPPPPPSISTLHLLRPISSLHLLRPISSVPSPPSISGADPGGARRLQPAARLPRLRRDAQWRRVPLSHVLRQRHRHEEQLLQLRAGPRRLLPHHQPLHRMARHRRRPPHPQPRHMHPRLAPAKRTRHEDPHMRMPHAHVTCTSHACACMHRHRPMHVAMQAARP